MGCQSRQSAGGHENIVVNKQDEFPRGNSKPGVSCLRQIRLGLQEVPYLLAMVAKESANFLAVPWGLINDDHFHLSGIRLGENVRYRRAKSLIAIVGRNYYGYARAIHLPNVTSCPDQPDASGLRACCNNLGLFRGNRPIQSEQDRPSDLPFLLFE